MLEKRLVVVGGPNGAGKTTFALKYAGQQGWTYVGADAIAAELSPSDPASQQFAAGRQFIERVRDLIVGSESFVVESTLSGRTFCSWIEKARQAGFTITMVFLFLDSPDSCVARVSERVLVGGHDVPEHDIRRRFRRSIVNFWQHYRPLADEWLLVYNSSSETQDIAAGTTDSFRVYDEERFRFFMEYVEADHG